LSILRSAANSGNTYLAVAMPPFRTIDYLLSGFQLPTAMVQTMTLQPSPATQVRFQSVGEQSDDDSDTSTRASVKSGQDQRDDDGDRSSGTFVSGASCDRQFAIEMCCEDTTENLEVTGAIGKFAMVKQDEDPEGGGSTPKIPALSVPTPVRTSNRTLGPCARHEDIVRDTIATPVCGFKPAFDTLDSSLRSPMQLPLQPGLGAHTLPSPLLDHMPCHVVPRLRPMDMKSPAPMLFVGKCGEANVSIGSVGHPYSCAHPCKWHTRSEKGCKEGDACAFCHLCKWTKSAQKDRMRERKTSSNLIMDSSVAV